MPETFQALQKANSVQRNEIIHREIDKLIERCNAVLLA